MSIKSSSKTFKEYYSDPVYKQRHLEYVKQKIPCTCGLIMARCNMGHHKKTKKHQKLLKLNNFQTTLDDLKSQTKKLLKKLKKFNIKK